MELGWYKRFEDISKDLEVLGASGGGDWDKAVK